MELSQEGDVILGRMDDASTSFESSVSELVMAEGLPPGADEQIVAHVRSMCPDSDHLPVRAEVRRPKTSVVAGEVTGRSVWFLKRYQGPFFAGYRVGDLRVGVTGEDQEVRFQGVVSDDGTQIEGRWRIPDPPRIARWVQRTEGSFLLRREGDGVA
jgi:hypothetical protein